MTEYNKNTPESIQHMFGTIAKQYDRTNAVLSFCMHHLWNRKLVEKVCGSKHPETMLDLCCGTGEIAFKYLKQAKKPCNAYLLDFCPEMLECAKIKSQRLTLDGHQLKFIQADAQVIPLEPDSVACATIAYGIRNVKSPEVCIRDVHRVLKSGGTFGILELTRPTNALLRMKHTFYLKYLLPILGRFLTSNKEAYQYLCNSIHNFSKPKELEQILLRNGFVNTQITPLFGGIATIITAQKP